MAKLDKIPVGMYHGAIVSTKVISTNGPRGDFPDDALPCVLVKVALGLDTGGQDVVLIVPECRPSARRRASRAGSRCQVAGTRRRSATKRARKRTRPER